MLPAPQTTDPMVPVLWQSGPFVLGTHDVFAVLAVVVGFTVYWADLRRRGWLDARIATVSLGVLLGGILGARLVTGWESLDDMGRAIDAGTPVSYALMHGNKSVVGALIGGYLGGVLTKRSLGYTPLDRRCLRARAADRDGHRTGRLLPHRAAARHRDDPARGA